MAKNIVYFFINGINSWPSSSKNWTGRSTTWVQVNTPYKAEKIEYLSRILTRTIIERSAVDKLYKTLSFYKDFKIVLVCHSNGGNIVTRMLNKYTDWPDIQAIHMISSASDADFERTNFNKFLKEGRIGKINIYIGGKDIAIRVFARTIIARLLGFRTMGLRGGYHIDESIEHKVNTFWNGVWKDYGHSSCFKPENFDHTMSYFVDNKKPTKKDIAKTIENKENDASIVLNKTEIKEIRKDN